jgi:hypothetical protein
MMRELIRRAGRSKAHLNRLLAGLTMLLAMESLMDTTALPLVASMDENAPHLLGSRLARPCHVLFSSSSVNPESHELKTSGLSSVSSGLNSAGGGMEPGSPTAASSSGLKSQ